MTEYRDEDLEIPDGLARDLRALMSPAEAPSADVDERVLAEAREVLPRVHDNRRAPRWWLPVAAALALAVWWFADRDVRIGDLDGDGRVDVVDVFAMARALRDGTETPASWDLTGDSVVDQADLERLEQEAVRL